MLKRVENECGLGMWGEWNRLSGNYFMCQKWKRGIVKQQDDAKEYGWKALSFSELGQPKNGGLLTHAQPSRTAAEE